ncbi:helix-turn-helix domain-containing protein [Corynebacterium meitnerae]|uniref:Helix-turn-helix domain-containing protein n=1 Tax=Corynebacterium meitnerae TaxID=2913498 RepID=A0A9X3LSB6_9CORY|nr:helix-turn-helix domain-containing protein [Corynebacterium meitnerae]MCZ9293310.1 helix-turn-helix domain-containing protein [Corynebacterium meitnerae]
MSLSPELVIYLMDNGYRQVDIAREYGVSRQYVYQLAKRAGYTSPITTVQENLPWDVDPEFARNSTFIAFRLVGHEAVAPGNLTKESHERAHGLLRRLRQHNVVVDYNPTYPPVIGLTSLPGFAYLPRTEEDEDFIMKIRPGVKVTPLGNKIWRLPSEK